VRRSSRLPTLIVGVALVLVSFAVYLLSARQFNAGRGDLFYLADALLHGRTWLTVALGPLDIILRDGRVYVPFAPFPAIALVPLVALVGPSRADMWQPIVNAGFAALDVGLAYWLAGRIGVERILGRVWIATVLGFSTAIWWVVTRGGVWHTGHLVATLLTLAALIECFGRRRALILGLLAGAAFLTRGPLALAIPFYAWVVWRWKPDPTFATAQPAVAGGWAPLSRRALLGSRAWPIAGWLQLALGLLPSAAFFFWYNVARFGSPFESGYALATLPPFLEQQRAQGLFSVAHLAMNLDYLFIHLPSPIGTLPFFRPDGLGMSIFLTSPALFLSLRADFRSGRTVALGVTAVAVLIPNVLYYGGGWLQYGYRYALDAIPFVLALCATAVARRGISAGWTLLLALGVLVNLVGVYWAYNL
jgi:hypothetical protein